MAKWYDRKWGERLDPISKEEYKELADDMLKHPALGMMGLLLLGYWLIAIDPILIIPLAMIVLARFLWSGSR